MRPPVAFESAKAITLLSLPLVIAIALPLGVAMMARARGLEIPALVVSGFLLAVGAYVAWFQLALAGPQRPPQRDALRRVPVVPPARVHESPLDSLVFVEGTVALGPLGAVAGPLTGRPCVRAEVHVLVTKRGDEGRRMVTMRDRVLVVPFRIVDPHGHGVLVDPADAGFEAAGRVLSQKSRHERVHEEGYAACLEHERITLGPDEDAVVSERALRVGERIVALGVVSGSGDYRQAAEVALRGDERDRLIVTTLPRATLVEGTPRSASSWWTLVLAVLAVGVGLATCGYVAFAG